LLILLILSRISASSSCSTKTIQLRTYNGTAIIMDFSIKSSGQKFSIVLDSRTSEGILVSEKKCENLWCHNHNLFKEPAYKPETTYNRRGNDKNDSYVMQDILEIGDSKIKQSFNILEGFNKDEDLTSIRDVLRRAKFRSLFDLHSQGKPAFNSPYDGSLGLAQPQNDSSMSLLENLLSSEGGNKLVSLWVGKKVQDGKAEMTIGRTDCSGKCLNEWQFVKVETNFPNTNNNDTGSSVKNVVDAEITGSWSMSITPHFPLAIKSKRHQHPQTNSQQTDAPPNVWRHFELDANPRLAIIDTFSQDILLPYDDFERFVTSSETRLYQSETQGGGSVRCDRVGLPTLNFSIEGKVYTLTQADYMTKIESNNCHIAIKGWNMKYWSLGHPFLRAYCVAFDLNDANKRLVGFAPASGQFANLPIPAVVALSAIFALAQIHLFC